MNLEQPPYLHQRQPTFNQDEPFVRQPLDLYGFTQHCNILGMILLLIFGFLSHSFPQMFDGLLFAGLWVLGVYTSQKNQYLFYIATILLVATTCVSGLHAIH